MSLPGVAWPYAPSPKPASWQVWQCSLMAGHSQCLWSRWLLRHLKIRYYKLVKMGRLGPNTELLPPGARPLVVRPIAVITPWAEWWSWCGRARRE